VLPTPTQALALRCDERGRKISQAGLLLLYRRFTPRYTGTSRTMLLLRMLGGPSLCDNGSTLTGPATQRHRLALLALLASSRSRPQSRDKLVAWLWPERDVENARNLLNQGVHALRRAIGDAGVISSQNELRLDPTTIAYDVAAFEDAVAAGELERAIGLYTGPFLDGFHLPGASEFEHWADGERERLRRLYFRSMEKLAHAAEERREWGNAVERWRALVAEEPYDARVTLRLMTALDGAGDRAGALHQARLHTLLLQQEFEAGPDPDVVALADRLRTAPANGDDRKVPASPPVGEARATSPHASASGPARLSEDQFALGADLTRGLDGPPSAAPSHGPSLPAVLPRRLGTTGAIRSLAAILGMRQRRLVILGITGVGLTVAAAMGTLLIRPADPPSLDANLVVIAPFDVFDPELGLWREGLVDLLSRDLDDAGALRAVSPRVAISHWKGRAEPAEARMLGRRTGAQLVVFGQVMRSGPDSVRLTATLFDVGRSRSLGDVDLRDASAHMDRLVDSTAVGLLRALGHHRPVGAVRQVAFGGTSLPALKEFLRGEQFYRRSAWDSALAHYGAATALDSTLALAYRRIWLSLSWSPPTAHSFQPFQTYAFRAAEFTRGLPARDSLLIMMDSLWLSMGWNDTAYFTHRRRTFAAAEEVARLNSNDPEVWNALGEVRFHAGTPAEFTAEELLAPLSRAIQLDPKYGPAYEHTVNVAIRLGRLDLARQYAEAYLGLVAVGTSTQQFRLMPYCLIRPVLLRSPQPG
jgi:serine/threonine-protein kinase